MSQAAVENKLLSGALMAIQAKQQERDECVLQRRKHTLREEDPLRRPPGQPGQEHKAFGRAKGRLTHGPLV